MEPPGELVLAYHPAPCPPGDRLCDHPFADRWFEVVRLDLGHDGGGPGFASDTIASVIYKQYQAGFYGLSTAGSVVLFLLVTAIVVPLTWWLNRGEV